MGAVLLSILDYQWFRLVNGVRCYIFSTTNLISEQNGNKVFAYVEIFLLFILMTKWIDYAFCNIVGKEYNICTAMVL